MLFSVVIPLYNKRDYIKETIESVLLQTYTDFDIIVVNDSSTDDSLAIVQSFNDSRIRIYTKPNGGVSDTRNYGLKKALGEYICFLDADDLWTSEYLYNLHCIILKYPFAGMICSAYSVFKESINHPISQFDLSKYDLPSYSLVDFFRYSVLEKKSIALTSAVCIKKDILYKITGPFPVGIAMGEDVNVWVRVASTTDVAYCNKPLMLYRLEASMSLCTQGKSIKVSYPYWEWYNLVAKSKYKNAFTTRMIYSLARKGYFNGEYYAVMLCLSKSKGTYLWFSRFVLLIRSLMKLCVYGKIRK